MKSNNTLRILADIIIGIFCLVAATWSFFQTRNALAMQFKPTPGEQAWLYELLLNLGAAFVQLGANPIWAIAHHLREVDGEYGQAMFLVYFGHGLQVIDFVTNASSWINVQYGGTLTTFFNVPFDQMLVRGFTVFLFCYCVTWAEEAMFHFWSDAFRAAGFEGMDDFMSNLVPKFEDLKRKPKGGGTKPATVLAGGGGGSRTVPRPPFND